jgi:hypothetical protein
MINAALIGHLRMLSTLSSETNADAAMNPSELASTSNSEVTRVSAG